MGFIYTHVQVKKEKLAVCVCFGQLGAKPKTELAWRHNSTMIVMGTGSNQVIYLWGGEVICLPATSRSLPVESEQRQHGGGGAGSARAADDCRLTKCAGKTPLIFTASSQTHTHTAHNVIQMLRKLLWNIAFKVLFSGKHCFLFSETPTQTPPPPPPPRQGGCGSGQQGRHLHWKVSEWFDPGSVSGLILGQWEVWSWFSGRFDPGSVDGLILGQ